MVPHTHRCIRRVPEQGAACRRRRGLLQQCCHRACAKSCRVHRESHRRAISSRRLALPHHNSRLVLALVLVMMMVAMAMVMVMVLALVLALVLLRTDTFCFICMLPLLPSDRWGHSQYTNLYYNHDNHTVVFLGLLFRVLSQLSHFHLCRHR